LLIKVLTSFSLTISGKIDNFLKHSVETAVDQQANAAADWVSTGRVCITICCLAIWHHLLLWVPFSEGKLVFVVLHLLGHDGSSVAWAVMEFDSVLSNMLTLIIIIVS
jgi:hypothetical protein